MPESLNKNRNIVMILSVLSILSLLAYQFIDVNMKFFDYAMSIRIPRIMGILIAGICIGTASIMFQSVINNRIVTPCLLGMNSLYILIQTIVFFVFGATSIIVLNENILFIVSLVIMGVTATAIYGYLFRKTNYNVLYVLLVGTVMATFFTSISNALMRVMDPNEYDSLQDSIISSFTQVDEANIAVSFVFIILIFIAFRKEIALLDVITLGKNQAINLGVDYDKVIMKILMSVTLLIAIATSMVGPISFLGLIIANISRQLFKTYKHTYLMAGSVLVGVIILFMGQIVIEHVFSYSTVISVFINLFGGIYFLYLIMKNKGVA
ncbi:CRISPR-associated protein Cas5 [Candidatus Epulonipiscium fishelsonii]|uniref:CRISPR-associated protein Cas5 n=1 Tax=Candidatus Epulonipiscium fishelsonii TaxID=77094 RepID=A0ACC8XGB7_9FIRM|nr:CRISPR-associated protein Cas5 [Epulopiscium sp. SCG-B05WGA-EpuloA1]ONI42480.1 CRISPR-associated protein Cas5 [Epulopiscium sp. SCG-B11WGA-EpuloA1]